MNARWQQPVLAAALFLAQAPVTAVIEVMTEGEVAQALNIANGSDAARALFHASYRVAIDDPIIEHLEIITEFRRFVLAAEDQVKRGNWMMARGGFDSGGRTLKDLLRPLGGQVAIRARLRFHPQNSYIAAPLFDILIGEPTLLPINVIRTPHITPATGKPNTRDVIDGLTIEAFYNAPTIADRVLPVRLITEGKDIARVNVDFARVQ